MTPLVRTRFEIWGPPILFILTLIGISIAAEHRITVLEESQRNTTEVLQDMAVTVRTMQESQIRVVMLLDIMDERHKQEDLK